MRVRLTKQFTADPYDVGVIAGRELVGVSLSYIQLMLLAKHIVISDAHDVIVSGEFDYDRRVLNVRLSTACHVGVDEDGEWNAEDMAARVVERCPTVVGWRLGVESPGTDGPSERALALEAELKRAALDAPKVEPPCR